MENIKQLNNLVDLATSDAQSQPPNQLYDKVLSLVNSRVDMPKHAITAISKRIGIKNKKVLLYSFLLLQYLAYNTELSLYSQISTKQFLFKISGVLMAKQIDRQVQDQILKTLHCFDQLFRPHDDLLPLFFQFYAQVLKKGFEVPTDYVSPYRPKQLKKYNKIQKNTTSSSNNASKGSRKQIQKPTKIETKTFEQIRQKLILTNQIIDNTDPAQGVKGNQLLIQMMEQVKQCQKKINDTINANPSQQIMEMALATNDDLYITYRRFKDLQRNKKPEPFILTQLASDFQKQNQSRSTVQQPKPVYKKPVQQPQPTKKKQQNILDLDFEPKKVQSPKKGGDIFDLMDISQPQKKVQEKPKNGQLSYDDLIGGGFSSNNNNPTNSYSNYSNNNFNTNNNKNSNITFQTNQKPYQGFSLNGPSENQFRTDADIQPYGNSAIDQLTDLSNFKDFLGGSK